MGQNKNEITPLYDLNNFNDYVSGVIALFQILVVNDWHEIAKVFNDVDADSTGAYVRNALIYPFFISANLFCVCMLVNVLIAFFVGGKFVCFRRCVQNSTLFSICKHKGGNISTITRYSY